MSTDEYGDRKWLFSADAQDDRGRLAASRFLNVDTLEKIARANEFIQGKYYDNKYVNGVTIRDNDVHPEFLQFIRDAAEYVKKVDVTTYTLNDKDQREFYDNVFAKWDRFSNDTRAFYDKYVELLQMNKTTNKWESIPSSQRSAAYSAAGNNPSDYRVNFKKFTQGQRAAFVGPYYTGSLLLAGDLPPATGSFHEGSAILDANMFRNLFEKTYNPNWSATIFSSLAGVAGKLYSVFTTLPPTPPGEKRFHVKLGELVRETLFRSSQAAVEDAEEVAERATVTLDCVECGLITRKNGKMYVNVNGKEEPVDVTDEWTKKAFEDSNKCYGTYVRAANSTECEKFLFESLLSDNSTDLDNWLSKNQNKDFFKVAREDIKNLHPVLAVRILQQFGFRKYQTTDENGMTIWKIESVNHWLKNYMKQRFNNDAKLTNLIKENETWHIITYLDLVSQYVNCNPAILNKNYTKDPHQALSQLEKTDLGRKLDLEYEQPRRHTSVDMGRLRGHLFVSKAYRNPFFVNTGGVVATPWGRQYTPGLSMLRGGAMSGGGKECEYVRERINRSGTVASYDMIAKFIHSFETQLARKNKTLSADTSRKIKENLNKYKQTETELLRTLCYLEEYNTLMDEFRNYNSEILTEANMQKIVNRFDVLSDKHGSVENQLVNIISKISDLLEDEDKNADGYKQVTTRDV